MNKKKILSLALVVLLICTISFGTLAWFNATEEVTNTFYVATSEEDGKPDFSIDVTERPDDNNGFWPRPGDLPDETAPDGGHIYKDILPGSTLNKDAFVKNTGHYDQWVRVHLIFSDAEVWKPAITKAFEAAKSNPYMPPIQNENQYVQYWLFANLFSDGFIDIHFENNGDAFGDDTLTYTFYYPHKLEENQEFKVLDSLVIPGVLEQKDMEFDDGSFSLKIKAEAIQADNLLSQNAFDAFQEVGWEVGKAYGEQSGE